MSDYIKHTITIYSDRPCTDIAFLAQQAVDGNFICESHETEPVQVELLPKGVASFFNEEQHSDEELAALCATHGVSLVEVTDPDDGEVGTWDWLNDQCETGGSSFDSQREAALDAINQMGLVFDEG